MTHWLPDWESSSRSLYQSSTSLTTNLLGHPFVPLQLCLHLTRTIQVGTNTNTCSVKINGYYSYQTYHAGSKRTCQRPMHRLFCSPFRSGFPSRRNVTNNSSSVHYRTISSQVYFLTLKNISLSSYRNGIALYVVLVALNMKAVSIIFAFFFPRNIHFVHRLSWCSPRTADLNSTLKCVLFSLPVWIGHREQLLICYISQICISFTNCKQLWLRHFSWINIKW